MIKVFIEYDPNERVAYHVQCQSVLDNTSEAVEFCPFKAKTPELLKDIKDWCLFLEKGFLVTKDLAPVFDSASRKKSVYLGAGAFLINAKAFNKIRNKSQFENSFPEKKTDELPYLGLDLKDKRPWLIDGERDQTWEHFWSSIDQSRGKAQTIMINRKAYEMVQPRFKAPGLKAFYQQLRDPDSDIFYILQPDRDDFKGGKFNRSLPQCVYIGNRLAAYFGLRTQSSSLADTAAGKQLFMEDIRGCPSVLSMECLANLDKTIHRSERDLEKICQSLKRISEQDLSSFIVKLSLFDYLIDNTNRNAGNIVWLELGQGLLGSSLHSARSFAPHEILIENICGFSEFIEGVDEKVHTTNELFDFITEHGQLETAMEFFEAMAPDKLREIIMESVGVEEALKSECASIIQKRYEELLKLEERVEARLKS